MSTNAVATNTALDAALPDGRWTLDPSRSTASFTAKGTWGLIPVNGSFKRMRGQLEIAGGVPSGGFVVEADSLDTGNAKRDTHLRSADFFDVDRHAEVVFRPKVLRSGPDGGASAEGILTVRTVAHRVTFDLTVTELDGGDLRVTGSTRVERANVGLTWNKMGMMRGDVGLSVDAYLVQA
jgi:polyisoprenoid-binding protein YceI